MPPTHLTAPLSIVPTVGLARRVENALPVALLKISLRVRVDKHFDLAVLWGAHADPAGIGRQTPATVSRAKARNGQALGVKASTGLAPSMGK